MSTIDYKKAHIQTLKTPEVTNRGGPSQSAQPYVGVTVYDKTSKTIYVGDGTNFVPCYGTGSIAPVSISAISGVGTPNALTIDATTQVLTAHAADVGNPGIITAGAQQFGGLKEFSNGLQTQTAGLSAGVNNILDVTINYDFSGGIILSGGAISDAAQNAALQRINGMCWFHMGPNLDATGAPGGVITFNQVAPPEFRPGLTAVYRTGLCNIIDNGTPSIGVFKILSADGSMTVGKSINSSGVLTGFTGGAGVTGLLDNCIVYSKY